MKIDHNDKGGMGMSGETVVRYKVHFVWQDDKEEDWLREMARQGLHLVKANMLCRYVFRRGAPADIAYRLDYRNAHRKDAGYYQLFQDAGWEHVLSCMGWEYWRKAADGAEPQIFTDAASKAARMRRVRSTLVAVGIPSLVAASNPVYLHHSHSLSSATHIGLAAIVVTLAALYMYGYFKLTKRIREMSSPA
jgi:hypothetical protein